MKNKGNNTKTAIVNITTPLKNLIVRPTEDHVAIPPPNFAPAETSHVPLKYPTLESLGIPTDFESEESQIKINQVIAELVNVHKEKERSITFSYVGNGYPGRLVAIPRALTRETFHKVQKKTGWLEEIVTHIASGKRRNKNDTEVLPPVETAALWICEALFSNFEESFTYVANKNGLHAVRKMSAVEAASMWSEANVGQTAAKIIIRHLTKAFGHSVQVPMKSIGTLTLDLKNVPTPTFGKYYYYKDKDKTDRKKKPEVVEWWMADYCAMIAADASRLLQVEIKKEEGNSTLTYGYPSPELGNGKLGVEVVIGSDHGGGKSRILGKINLTDSQSRRDMEKIEHGARIQQFGNIDCKKDKAEILECIAPSLNETLKKLEDGMLIGIKDEDKNVEVHYVPKKARASLAVSKNEDKVSLQWIERDEEGCENLKEAILTSLKIQDEPYHFWTVVDNFVHFVTGDLAFLATIQGRDESSHCRCPWCDLSANEWSKKTKDKEGRPLTLSRLDFYGRQALQYYKDLSDARSRQEAAKKAKHAIIPPIILPTVAPTNAPSTINTATMNPSTNSSSAAPSSLSSTAAATATIPQQFSLPTVAAPPPPANASTTNTSINAPTYSSNAAPPSSTTTATISQRNALPSASNPPPTPSRITLPQKPDTKGVKSMPQWRIEPRRLIVPLLHLEIGLLNKAWTSLNRYLDIHVENLSEKEMKLRQDLNDKDDTITDIEETIQLTMVQKQAAHDHLSSLRTQLAQAKKDRNSKSKSAPLTKEQKSILLEHERLIQKSIEETKTLKKDLQEKLTENKENKAKLRAKVIKLKKEADAMQKIRLGDEDGLDTIIEGILNDTAKIYPQAFHGGEMNGVCCLRFLNNVEEIMAKVSEVSHERLKTRRRSKKEDKMVCTTDTLTKILADYTNLFRVMDLSFSLLRIPAPTKDEIKEARKAVFVLEHMWNKVEINITPKAHVMFTHAVEQFEMFGGIADKVEDFIEKAHQLGKKLEYLTSRLPTNCYRRKQLIHINRMWLQQNPEVQEQSKQVLTSSKCKLTKNVPRPPSKRVMKRTAVKEKAKQVVDALMVMVVAKNNNIDNLAAENGSK